MRSDAVRRRILSMKIVIIGLGKVGRSLAKNLSDDGHDIVVVDNQPQLVYDAVNSMDVQGISGNGGSYEIQKEAGADLLIAATSSDEINILSCFLAKKLGTKNTIARIRNQEYEKQVRFLRTELGLSMAINPEKEVAREISRIIRFPNAMNIESFARRKIELIEYRITENNPIADMKLSDLYGAVRVKVLICAVLRNGETYIPSGNFVLKTGDIIYLTASPKNLELFFRNLGLYKSKAKNVMIVGASNMGYYLARDLTDAGMSVKIIDSDEERCQKMSEKLPKSLVIVGDANDSDLMEEEGIANTDAFVSLTGMDETNIILAVYASKQNVPKVIAKVNRKPFADIAVSGNLIDTVVSTGTVTSNMILQYVRSMQLAVGRKVASVNKIIRGNVNALEFNVHDGCRLIDIPFKNLRVKDNTLVAGIVRKNGDIIIPDGNTSFSIGDDVVIVTTDNKLDDLNEIVR